jgi:branched-chain amino acid transport system substrate-binding protein
MIRTIGAVCLLLLAVVAGAGGGAAEEPISIGVSVSLTGNFARLGALELTGLQLWAETVNAAGGIASGGRTRPVRLIVLDDQSDPLVSTRLTQRLITEDRVQFLIGPYSSGITQATTAIAERYRVITIAPLANAPVLYHRKFRYLFGVLPLATQYLEGVLDLARTFSPRPVTVAILSPNNIFSLAAASGARDYAEHHGFTLVAYKEYPGSAQDFTGALSQLKSLNPDIVLGTGYLNDSIQMVKQMAQLGFSPRVLGFTIATSVPDFARSLGGLAEGVVGGEWWEPTYRYPDPVFGSTAAFVEAYQQRYREPATYYAAAGATAGVLLQMAIARAGTLDSDRVREALLGLDATTLFGPIRFSPEGINLKAAPAASQIIQGRAVPVYPLSAAAARAVYPKPPFR